jgi:hypothetical protein
MATALDLTRGTANSHRRGLPEIPRSTKKHAAFGQVGGACAAWRWRLVLYRRQNKKPGASAGFFICAHKEVKHATVLLRVLQPRVDFALGLILHITIPLLKASR